MNDTSFNITRLLTFIFEKFADIASILLILILELSTTSYEFVYCNNDVFIDGFNFLIGAIYNAYEKSEFNEISLAFNIIVLLHWSFSPALYPIAIAFLP